MFALFRFLVRWSRRWVGSRHLRRFSEIQEESWPNMREMLLKNHQPPCCVALPFSYNIFSLGYEAKNTQLLVKEAKTVLGVGHKHWTTLFPWWWSPGFGRKIHHLLSPHLLARVTIIHSDSQNSKDSSKVGSCRPSFWPHFRDRRESTWDIRHFCKKHF